MRRIQQGWHIGWLQVTSRSFYSIHERDRKYLSTLGPEETAQTSVLLQFRRSVFDLAPDIAEEPRFGEVSFSRPRAEIYTTEYSKVSLDTDFLWGVQDIP